MSFGKVNLKFKAKLKSNFNDVAGVDEAKEELKK